MLKNFWYAIAFSHEITEQPSKHTVLGQQLVVFRQKRSGRVVVMSDLCVHRGGALSGGWQDDKGCVVCPYHGWEYDADGKAVRIPANLEGRPIPKKARVDSYPVQEKYRFVWVFLGDLPEEERPPIPNWDEHFNDPSLRAVEGQFLWNANYERVMENGCDIAPTQTPTPTATTPPTARAASVGIGGGSGTRLRRVTGLLKMSTGHSLAAAVRRSSRSGLTAKGWPTTSSMGMSVEESL
jgi:nitrite reductase/ring-hydroxylating ferredoxin subunit